LLLSFSGPAIAALSHPTAANRQRLRARRQHWSGRSACRDGGAGHSSEATTIAVYAKVRRAVDSAAAELCGRLLKAKLSARVQGYLYVAMRITHGSLVAGHLRIVGTGAVPRSGVTIDGGPTGVPADARGRFKFDIVGFSEPSCVATLDDGSVSVQTTLTGCAPSAPPPPVPPAAPTPTGPPGGASIVQPFALTWSAPRSNGLIGFRWQIATSPTFSALTLTDVATPRSRSTATLSGLFNGRCYWRTQAIRTAPQPLVTLHGPWSTVQSFTVTGSAPGTPAAPVLTPPAQRAYHPVESFTLSWTAVANAAKYRVEMANAAGFSPDSNLTDVAVAGTSFATPPFGFETPLFIRVRGVTAGGLQGPAIDPGDSADQLPSPGSDASAPVGPGQRSHRLPPAHRLLVE
jgi:hypothetical protein